MITYGLYFFKNQIQTRASLNSTRARQQGKKHAVKAIYRTGVGPNTYSYAASIYDILHQYSLKFMSKYNIIDEINIIPAFLEIVDHYFKQKAWIGGTKLPDVVGVLYVVRQFSSAVANVRECRNRKC